MGGWDLLWKRAGISELAASWVHWLPSHSNDDSSMSSRNYKIIEVSILELIQVVVVTELDLLSFFF
jgi:hypothetical protein